MQLPYVLFAYPTSIDKRVPLFPVIQTRPKTSYGGCTLRFTQRPNVDVNDYKVERVTGLSLAWEAACRNVERAQQKQKKVFRSKSQISRIQSWILCVHICSSQKSG